MNSNLKPEERLCVAVDIKPEKNRRTPMRRRILSECNKYAGLGVYIKLNSALRCSGYDVIMDIHDMELRVFADLKLSDITNTMETDGQLLSEYSPELVTAICSSGVEGLRRLQLALGNHGNHTEVLGVTVLTNLSRDECLSIYGSNIKSAVSTFRYIAQQAAIGGLILAPSDIEYIKSFNSNLTLNCPNIRPEWANVKGDDQNKSRSMTPKQAIQAGADRLVIGRPITQACPNNKGLPQSPREAVEWTLEEIASAM